MRLRLAAVLALMAGAVGGAGVGCYDPSVTSGRLMCASSGKACPDGFVCSGGFCVKPGTGSGTGGAGTGGAGTGGVAPGTGGAGGMCANGITPLCQSNSGSSSDCDPVCQTGCGCGQRCNLTTTGLGCAVPAGSKMVGTVCQPGADDCAPGLVCLAETCGTALGRCYRYCRDASMCGASGVCGTPIDLPGATSSQRVCNLGDSPCDAFARTGCADPALNCYVTGPSHTTCDCPTAGNHAQGETCDGYNDCSLGLACLSIGGASRCYKLCRNATDCAGCMALGTAGGYCPQ